MLIPGNIKTEYSLKELNWWKVGGPADFFTQPESIEELKGDVQWAFAEGIPITVLSGGSNVLISDKGIRGLVVQMSKFKGIEVVEEKPHLKLSVLAGTPKSDVAKIFLQHQLDPAVFLTGLPGDMGGGVVMNAGVGEDRTPREFCEITKWVDVLRHKQADHAVERIENINWVYRQSDGWQPGIIIKVGIEWPNESNPEVMKGVRAATKNRVSRQPLNLPSGGSTFRNPEGGKAAQLIDQCGLKGFRVGGACVSEKHANFIVNDQGGTASDIAQIIQHVHSTVLKEKGIDLHQEVIQLGEW